MILGVIIEVIIMNNEKHFTINTHKRLEQFEKTLFMIHGDTKKELYEVNMFMIHGDINKLKLWEIAQVIF